MLHRFSATTDALTCAGQGFRPIRGPVLDCPRQGSLLHARDLPSIPSPPTSRVQPGFSFVHRSALAFISGCGYLHPAWGFAHHSQARPARYRRIGFVILRTGRSPPLLPTLESLQRSPFGYRGMNFSRRRTSTALITPLAGARARTFLSAATRVRQQGRECGDVSSGF